MEQRRNEVPPIRDYPKTKCVFRRIVRDGSYVVTPTVTEGCEWVLEAQGVRAVDKLHGTNICVTLNEQGHILAIDNRSNRIHDGISFDVRRSKEQARALLGVLEAVRRGWFDKIQLEPGFNRVYGELIGPNINGNLHGVDRPMFVPFQHLKETCSWKTWIENRYSKTFDSLRKWFIELPSLFSKKYIKKNVLAEGLVFWHPDGRMAKLRRDMFDWHI